jgi:hypothetical protein
MLEYKMEINVSAETRMALSAQRLARSATWLALVMP